MVCFGSNSKKTDWVIKQLLDSIQSQITKFERMFPWSWSEPDSHCRQGQISVSKVSPGRLYKTKKKSSGLDVAAAKPANINSNTFVCI